MSQIALLHLIPESSIATIRAAAVPQKAGWFAEPRDVFWETMHGIAPDVLNLERSGYAVVVLFEFLGEQRGFDFSAVDGHTLADFLSKSRRSYFAVFEPEAARAFVQKLSGENLSEAALTTYAHEFSGGDDADAGQALLEAARSLLAALVHVKPGVVGVLHVG